MSASLKLATSSSRKSTSRPSRWKSARSCSAASVGGGAEEGAGGARTGSGLGSGFGASSSAAAPDPTRKTFAAKSPSKSTRKKETQANHRRVTKGSGSMSGRTIVRPQQRIETQRRFNNIAAMNTEKATATTTAK